MARPTHQQTIQWQAKIKPYFNRGMPASFVSRFPEMPSPKTINRYYKKWVEEIKKAETQDIVERQLEVKTRITSAIANQIEFLVRQENNMLLEESALLDQAKNRTEKLGGKDVHTQVAPDGQPFLTLKESRYSQKTKVAQVIMEGLVLLGEVETKVTIDEEVKSKVREWIADETHKASLR